MYRCIVGIAARLRRAMVDVGLVHRKDDRTTIEPRLPAGSGRTVNAADRYVLKYPARGP